MKRLLIAALALITGCATTPSPESTPPDPRAVTILARDGVTTSWEVMLDAAATADVVIIGELHGHVLGLDVAASLWDDLLVGADDPALSLEFIDRDHQAALDDYLLDVIDEETFRDLARRSDGNYPPGHARMVEAAKASGARVYAANAPRRYTAVARDDGLHALRDLRASQQRLYDVPDSIDNGDYRRRFDEVMGGMMAAHGADDIDEEERQTRLDGFFRAQQVWDATMAATISRALADGPRPVVHVVGQFHADHDGGTLLALRERRPDAKIVTISMEDSADLADEDVGRADFIILVGAR